MPTGGGLVRAYVASRRVASVLRGILGTNLFARVYERIRGEYLRRLSRRTTNAMRQEAHDYGPALGSFVPGACAAAAKMRTVSPVAISPARFRRGEHATALIIGAYSSLSLRQIAARGGGGENTYTYAVASRLERSLHAQWLIEQCYRNLRSKGAC